MIVISLVRFIAVNNNNQCSMHLKFMLAFYSKSKYKYQLGMIRNVKYEKCACRGVFIIAYQIHNHAKNPEEHDPFAKNITIQL